MNIEDVPDSSVDQPFIEVTSFPELTFASTPSLKKKPIKNRPLLTTITSSTTPTFTLDQSENEESLQSVTISSSTTITPAVTSLTISKKPNPVLDYSKGKLKEVFLMHFRKSFMVLLVLL